MGPGEEKLTSVRISLRPKYSDFVNLKILGEFEIYFHEMFPSFAILQTKFKSSTNERSLLNYVPYVISVLDVFYFHWCFYMPCIAYLYFTCLWALLVFVVLSARILSVIYVPWRNSCWVLLLILRAFIHYALHAVVVSQVFIMPHCLTWPRDWNVLRGLSKPFWFCGAS